MEGIIGSMFNRWNAKALAGKSERGVLLVICECSCELKTQRIVRLPDLKSGHSKSCGCLQREEAAKSGKATFKHGLIKSSTYYSWADMKQRCYNPRNHAYCNYGARGITVCVRWRNSFQEFLADMGMAPAGGTLERIDNSGNYEPGNCKWADMREQSNNRRSNRLLKAHGREQTVSEWARELGMPKNTLHSRLRAGWPLEKALTAPLRK